MARPKCINVPRTLIKVAIDNGWLNELAFSVCVKMKYGSSVFIMGDGNGVRKMCRDFHCSAPTARRILANAKANAWFMFEGNRMLALPYFDHYKVKANGDLVQKGESTYVIKIDILPTKDIGIRKVRTTLQQMFLACHIVNSERIKTLQEDNLKRTKFCASPRRSYSSLGKMIGMSRQAAYNRMKALSAHIEKITTPVHCVSPLFDVHPDDVMCPFFVYDNHIWEQASNTYRVRRRSFYKRFVNLIPSNRVRIKDNARIDNRTLAEKSRREKVALKSSDEREMDEMFKCIGGQYL